jgi:aerobic-type carbon monoxide dehydrogenase small subunit (CoxS/CutS family)
MRSISLTVNGRQITRDVDPEMPLLYLLSDDLALRGPKFGCGQALCGSCTALVNGRRSGCA